MSRTYRILVGLVAVMVIMSIAVGVLFWRDRVRADEARREVCTSIANLREGIIRAFANLGTDLSDPAVHQELQRLRANTDCVTETGSRSNVTPTP